MSLLKHVKPLLSSARLGNIARLFRAAARERHFPTVAWVQCKRLAISLLLLPSTDQSTAFARATRAWGSAVGSSQAAQLNALVIGQNHGEIWGAGRHVPAYAETIYSSHFWDSTQIVKLEGQRRRPIPRPTCPKYGYRRRPVVKGEGGRSSFVDGSNSSATSPPQETWSIVLSIVRSVPNRSRNQLRVNVAGFKHLMASTAAVAPVAKYCSGVGRISDQNGARLG